MLSGCQDYATAIRTAEKIVHGRHAGAGGDAPGRDAEFWDGASAQALGGCLHAAALSGLPASSVRAWLAGPAASSMAAEILATHPAAARQAAAALRSALDPRPAKTTQVIRYMAAEAFAVPAGDRLG